MMVAGIIIALLFLFIGWLLVSPFSIKADTRVPYITFHWKTIGSAVLNYENDLLLHIQVLFFHKTISVLRLNPEKKKLAEKKKKAGRKMSFSKMKRKLLRMLKTFRVKEWQAAIDTGDPVMNARLYPAGFLPYCNGHLHINFTGHTYLYFDIRNRPWKLLLAFLI